MLAMLLSPLWHSHGHHAHPGTHTHAPIQTAASLTHAGHAEDGGDRSHHSHASHTRGLNEDRPAEPFHNEEDCGLCAVLHAPTGSGLPVPTVVWQQPVPCAIFSIPPSPVASASFLPVLWPCGPPRSA
jgi:hypothetical protein